MLPPGNLGWPVVGETLDFFRDPEFSSKRHRQYGPVFKTRLLGSPTVFIKGAEGNRFILSHENEFFRVSWPPSVKTLLGPLSLAVQSGPGHLQRRKLMAQAFAPRALAGYLEAMAAISDRYLQRWLTLGEFAWYPELRDYTLDVACKLLVGLDDGAKTELGHLYETWCEGLFSFPVNLPWTPFGKALRCRAGLLAAIDALIQQRRSQQPVPDASAPAVPDALDLLLEAKDEAGQSLSVDELQDQILTLLFAGHETLASSLTAFCLLVGQHPEVLALARTEQAQLQVQGQDQPLTFELLKEMPYLDQVIKEVLRLIPPVGGGFREVIQACEYGGYEIPKGWSTLYQIGPTHQDAEIYTQPEKFDPDRFSPDRAEDKAKPFANVPFGGGLRECLGKEFARLEMKVFAVRLLRDYDWEILPNQALDLITIPTPRPRDGLKVRLKGKG